MAPTKFKPHYNFFCNFLILNNLPRMDSNHDKVIQSQFAEVLQGEDFWYESCRNNTNAGRNDEEFKCGQLSGLRVTAEGDVAALFGVGCEAGKPGYRRF